MVLYEMLTGRLPFRGEYDAAIMYAILHEEPALLDQISSDLAKILQKALVKDPDKRYQTADETAGALRAISGIEYNQEETATKPTKWLGIIAGAMIILLAVDGYLLLPSHQEREKQLIEVKTDTHLWSKTFEGKLDSVCPKS